MEYHVIYHANYETDLGRKQRMKNLNSEEATITNAYYGRRSFPLMSATMFGVNLQLAYAGGVEGQVIICKREEIESLMKDHKADRLEELVGKKVMVVKVMNTPFWVERLAE